MKLKNFSLNSENKISETDLTEIGNFYEIGKWFGDRIGFPRVGLVSKTPEMIKDTYEFLLKTVDKRRITVEIHVKNPATDLSNILAELSANLGIKADEIKVTPNPGMHGNYVIRVFTQSRVLFRELERLSESISERQHKEIAKFLAGYADAEMTVEKRTLVLAFSITAKKPESAKKIKSLLETILSGKISIRSAGNEELKIQVPNELIPEFNDKIGKFMRNNSKRLRLNDVLNNNYFLPQDKEILDFIENHPMCTARDLSEVLHIHSDSARRILRLLSKQRLIKKHGRGIRAIPYCYSI